MSPSTLTKAPGLVLHPPATMALMFFGFISPENIFPQVSLSDFTSSAIPADKHGMFTSLVVASQKPQQLTDYWTSIHGYIMVIKQTRAASDGGELLQLRSPDAGQSDG